METAREWLHPPPPFAGIFRFICVFDVWIFETAKGFPLKTSLHYTQVPFKTRFTLYENLPFFECRGFSSSSSFPFAVRRRVPATIFYTLSYSGPFVSPLVTCRGYSRIIIWICNYLTDFMVKTPSWGTNVPSPVSVLLRKAKVHYRIHKSLQHVLVLRHRNQVYVLSFNFRIYRSLNAIVAQMKDCPFLVNIM